MTLKDKVIIVTGATAGIGLEIVKHCLELGGKVMIHCSPNSEKIATELALEFGDNTAYVCADLSKFDQLENIVNKTVETLEKLIVLSIMQVFFQEIIY